MTRFLTILAAAAVAGAMYVAAAPGGLRAASPTAKQFNALTKKVTALQKELGQVKKLSESEAGFLLTCLLYHAQAVDRVGTAGGTGYFYGTLPTATSTTTALDLAPTGEAASQFYLLGVKPGACVTTINKNGGTAAAFRTGSLRQLLARAAAQAGR